MAEKPDKEVKKKDTLAEYKGEFRQIKWPTKKELRKQVITVIITCIIVTIGIFVMDYTISLALDGLGRAVGIEEFDWMSQFDFDFGDFDMGDGSFDDGSLEFDLGDLGIDFADLPEGVEIDIVDVPSTDEMDGWEQLTPDSEGE